MPSSSTSMRMMTMSMNTPIHSDMLMNSGAMPEPYAFRGKRYSVFTSVGDCMKLATFSASIVVPSPKKSVIAVEVFSATRSVFTVSMLVCKSASTPSVWSSALLAVASVSESWPVSEIAWSTSTRCADAAAARFPTATFKFPTPALMAGNVSEESVSR